MHQSEMLPARCPRHRSGCASKFVSTGENAPADYWDLRCLVCAFAINPTEQQLEIHQQRLKEEGHGR